MRSAPLASLIGSQTTAQLGGAEEHAGRHPKLALPTRPDEPVLGHSREPMIRSALESLALRYRMVLEHLDRTIDRWSGLEVDSHRRRRVARTKLLCQMAADSRAIVAWSSPAPIEATAIGQCHGAGGRGNGDVDSDPASAGSHSPQ